jgi:hypothetical protein
MTRFLTTAALIAALIGPARAESQEDALKMYAVMRTMPTICNREAPMDIKLSVIGYAKRAGLTRENSREQLRNKKADLIDTFRDYSDEKRATECDALVAWIRSVAGQPPGPVKWKGLQTDSGKPLQDD